MQEVSLPWSEIKPMLKAADMIGVDTETNYIDDGQHRDIRDGTAWAIGISFAVEMGGVYWTCYLPFRHEAREGMIYEVGENEDQTVLAEVREFLESYSGYLVFHNAKFDLVSLRTLGIDYKGKFYCTLVISHLVDENLYAYDLTSVARKWIGPEESKEDTPAFKALVKAFGYAGTPIKDMKIYAAHDAALGLGVMIGIMDTFKVEVSEAYWQHKQDFIRLMTVMEGRGIRIDVELCEHMTKVGDTTMASLTDTIGGNLGSRNFLEEVLLDRLGLPIVQVTKSGQPSFNKDAMEEYDILLSQSDEPLARYIVEYRGWQKSVSSNYIPYVTLLSPDGRLRPNYKLHGTKTGRSSCEKPNLQQIPRKGVNPWNGRMKKAFIPDPGYGLYEADYAQLELRLGTAYAKEQSLIEEFAKEDSDIFTAMSTGVKLPRQKTKTFVYSTQYGSGIEKLARALGISEAHAKRIRANYQSAYPGFTAKSKQVQNLAKTKRRFKYWSGRYRHFTPFEAKFKAYKAFNSLIQGGSADIVEHVMVRLWKEVDNDECRMLLTVHDSVIFEILLEKVDYYREKIVAIMEDVRPNFGVHFAVDFHVWGE